MMISMGIGTRIFFMYFIFSSFTIIRSTVLIKANTREATLVLGRLLQISINVLRKEEEKRVKQKKVFFLKQQQRYATMCALLFHAQRWHLNGLCSLIPYNSQ